MFTLIILLSSVFLSIYLWQKRLYNTWKNAGLLQVKAVFPLGSIKLGRNFIHTLNEYYTEFKGKTDALGTYKAISPSIVLLNLDLIKQVLVKDFNSFIDRGFYHNEKDDPVSANLFLIDGPKWRTLRAKMSPTFTSGKIKAMCPIIIGIGDRLKQVMDVKVENGDKGIDMREMLARFTTDVIGNCAYGFECNSLENPDAEFRKIGMKAFSEPPMFIFKRLMMISMPNLSRKLGIRQFSKECGDFFIKAVNDMVIHRLKNNIKRNDFINLLIEMKNDKKSNSMDDVHMDGLSMDEIAAQCFGFFLAGFETSSSTSSFTLYELAQNQEVQEKLRNHIKEILSKHDDKLTYAALKDMTYLDECLFEGMRLYPSVPVLNRRVTVPYKLPKTEVILKTGTMVSIPTYAIHHDPDIYPAPEKYDPERFSADEVAKRHPFAFLPFGEGTRNCIGARFGMVQSKIGLAVLLSNYRFYLSAHSKPVKFMSQSFFLTPTDGLYLDVEKI